MTDPYRHPWQPQPDQTQLNPLPVHGQQPYAPDPYAPQPYPQQPYPPQGYAPQYPAPYGYGFAPRSTNGMAIASMVLGILWLYWVGSVLAVIFGFIARSQIRRRGDNGDGMAIAGLVLGWIGVGTLLLIVALLVGI